eukprot:764176-Hanusia_phi.AAC.1
MFNLAAFNSWKGSPIFTGLPLHGRSSLHRCCFRQYWARTETASGLCRMSCIPLHWKSFMRCMLLRKQYPQQSAGTGFALFTVEHCWSPCTASHSLLALRFELLRKRLWLPTCPILTCPMYSLGSLEQYQARSTSRAGTKPPYHCWSDRTHQSELTKEVNLERSVIGPHTAPARQVVVS